MAELPTGTVTFLFTDIEGSTARWEHQPEAMRLALARHDQLVRSAIERHGGHVVKTMGDAFHAAFSRAPDAIAAALDAQRRLQAEPWAEIAPDLGPLRVRMAVHTGAAEERDGDYYGPPLNRAARLMSAGHGGQVLVSLTTTELISDSLPDGASLLDLGDRRLKDLIRPERIFQLTSPDLQTDFPPLRTLDARPNNLPQQTTRLLGREREVATVRDRLLQANVRLVTLTGPGGTGKTRLGLQAAAELLDSFEDGVFFVPLASVADPDLVPATIAQVLGIRDLEGRSALEMSIEYVRERSLLLVLDNFEQLLPAGSCVAELLAAGLGVKVLVTSRAALQLRGEHEFAVPPLELPDLTPQQAPDALLKYAAVALFVERVASIRPTFVLTAESSADVVEICIRLDGLPLAIELAAARLRLFSPRALLARMEHRLPLLTGGAQDLPARHQTLRRAIAWSYDLLDQTEQRVFRRLSVCVGGFTLEAAEGMCATVAGGVIDALDATASLAAKSLIRQDESDRGELRFAMLETIREYGLECLEGSGETSDARRCHAEYYLGLAEQASPMLRGPEQQSWLTRLEVERDNLRSVLSWSQAEAGDPEIGLRMAWALQWYWNMRFSLAEGLRLLEAVLARTADTPSALRAKVLFIAAMLAKSQLDLDRGQTLLAESLNLARAYGDVEGTASALGGLSDLALERGDFDRARACAEEAFLLIQDLGDRRMIALAHAGLGRIAHVEGDYPRAESAYEQSLAIRRALKDMHGIAWSLHYLALIAVERDDRRRALVLEIESLTLRHDVDDRRGIAGCLEGLADLAIRDDHPERGTYLLAAAGALRETLNAPRAADEENHYKEVLAAAQARLPLDTFEVAWAEGRAMSVEQAVTYALAAPDST